MKIDSLTVFVGKVFIDKRMSVEHSPNVIPVLRTILIARASGLRDILLHAMRNGRDPNLEYNLRKDQFVSDRKVFRGDRHARCPVPEVVCSFSVASRY
jgi:hypothetical protein